MEPCHVVTVDCLPHTRPARGTLSTTSLDVAMLRPSDFCQANGGHTDWLPRHVGDALQSAGEGGRCLPCPTYSLLPNYGVNVDAVSECVSGRRYRVLQCLPAGLSLPPPQAEQLTRSSPGSSTAGSSSSSAASGRSVLLVHSDNRGHGLFAMVERVANQILYARAVGLDPYVFIGEYVFAQGRACEHGRVPYYDASSGPNVWEYYFLQPSARFQAAPPSSLKHRSRDAASSSSSVASSSSSVASSSGSSSSSSSAASSIQIVSPESLYALALPGNHTLTYTGDSSYDAERRYAYRAAANRLFARGSLVRPEHLRRVEALFAPWRKASKHILGLHVRGTDKVVAKKVPPEAYFPFVDAWIAAHDDALVFVATDERAYHDRITARYGTWGGTWDWRGSSWSSERNRTGLVISGRVVSAGRGYDSRNVIADSSISGHAKGVDALVDALLLSKSDFLLKAYARTLE